MIFIFLINQELRSILILMFLQVPIFSFNSHDEKRNNWNMSESNNKRNVRDRRKSYRLQKIRCLLTLSCWVFAQIDFSFLSLYWFFYSSRMK